MRRQPVMVVLRNIVIVRPRGSRRVDMDGGIRKIPKMVKEFVPELFRNRMALFHGKG